MNDRELLELAAKAAGLNYTWCEFWETMARPLKDGSGWNHRFVWNPMRDDAAAFRLAVQLGLQVLPGCARDPDGNLSLSDANEDVYAATRDAIVMAAAEIGRAMP